MPSRQTPPRGGGGGEADTAYWQIGEVAYALVSSGVDRTRLGQWAGQLSRTLY